MRHGRRESRVLIHRLQLVQRIRVACAVDTSMFMAKAAGMGGETRSSLGTNSSVAARPPGLSAARTFFSRPTQVAWSKWWRKFVSSTAS